MRIFIVNTGRNPETEAKRRTYAGTMPRVFRMGARSLNPRQYCPFPLNECIKNAEHIIKWERYGLIQVKLNMAAKESITGDALLELLNKNEGNPKPAAKPAKKEEPEKVVEEPKADAETKPKKKRKSTKK